MAEVTTDNPPKTSNGLKNYSRLKDEYAPHRKKTEDMLRKLKYDPEKHRKLRLAFARLQLEEARESERDELTELLNEKGFARRVIEELHRAQRTKTPSTLIFLDANGLKKINDTEGHAAGDEMIKKIGNSIKDKTRDTDVAARLHGDEFAILLTNTDQEGTDECMTRMKDAFEQRGVSVSAGSKVIMPEEIGSGKVVRNMEVFLKRADEKMYEAKIQSRETGVNVYKS